ncbi:hypothetical protein CSIM01_09445 [Colletotrichum simmondsii]|uniref:Uncharacterized protein n=1 Tax=Colletotrichum simmondsii TaxID=703756 RepID=A0A135S770_9PEZI|nr:hypothetical protein CSIM01_09445 [Colletotrichum simmondsii]
MPLPLLRMSMRDELGVTEDIAIVVPSETSPRESTQNQSSGRDAPASIDMSARQSQPGQGRRKAQGIPPSRYDRGYQNTASLRERNTVDSHLGRQFQRGAASDTRIQGHSEPSRPSAESVLRDAEIQRLQEKFQRQEKRTAECMEEVTKYRSFAISARREARDTKEQLARTEKSHRRDMQKLHQHISELDGQIIELKAQMLSHENQRLNNQAIANPNKVSDDAIRSGWKRMTYNIQNIAAVSLTACPTDTDILRHGHKDKLCAVCRMTFEHYKLLQNDDLRASVIEGYIWRAVFRRIFPSVNAAEGSQRYEKSWAGTPGMIFTSLLDSLLDAANAGKLTPSELLQWKANSANMIDRAMGFDEDDVEDAIYEEYEGLVQFLPVDSPDCEAQKSQLYGELRKVFKDAVELLRIFMKSKAHFFIDWDDASFTVEGDVHYQPGLHEAEVWEKDLSAKSTVKFVISPRLIKAGNADGDNYDKKVHLAKASVVCD